LRLPAGRTIKQILQNRDLGECMKPLMQGPPNLLRWATIHEAKGKDYDAVCLILPKPRRQMQDVIDHWESGTDDEALRVLYVGATRARKLLVLAIEVPERLKRVESLLAQRGITCDQI
jgi:ATP-dependent exoDNAse (exonuclease V) beta subunit